MLGVGSRALVDAALLSKLPRLTVLYIVFFLETVALSERENASLLFL